MFPLNTNTQKNPYPFSKKPAIGNFYQMLQRTKLHVRHEKSVPATTIISEERSSAQAGMQSTF